MVDENACKSFVEHQEFLAMKAQKRASERNTLPNIDWNNEDHVSSLTAHKLRLCLKQDNLQVSGGKATLVARVLRYVRAAQQILEPEDNDATSDSELQPSDSEDPDDSEDVAHQKTMHNQALQIWATLSNTVTRYSLSQTLMSNVLQCKASKGFRYIFYICRWWLQGGGGCVIIFGRFGGGSELICLC